MSTGTDHYFVSLEIKEHIVLMPSYIGRIDKGIFEHLNRRVLRYSQELNGVLISYSNLVILQNSGLIVDDNPQIHFDLKYSACVFQPPVGCVLQATVNRTGDGYVSCLSQNCFNIYISVNDSTGSHNVSIGDIVSVRIIEPSSTDDDLILIGELVMEDVSVPFTPPSKRKKKHKHSDNRTKRSLDVSSPDVIEPPLKKLKSESESGGEYINGLVVNSKKKKKRKKNY